jgi:hypothetical protein
MRLAGSAGVLASAGTLMAGPARAEAGQDAVQAVAAPDKQVLAGTSNHVPISIFVRGRQQIQLTGTRQEPGSPQWHATAADPSVVHVTVAPVQIGPFPVEYWELTVTGLKRGSTQVHVQETQATNPIKVLYDFVLDVTVLGLLE